MNVLKALMVGLLIMFAAICSAVIIWFFAMEAALSEAVSAGDPLEHGEPDMWWNIFLLVTGSVVVGWILAIWSLVRSVIKQRKRRLRPDISS